MPTRDMNETVHTGDRIAAADVLDLLSQGLTAEGPALNGLNLEWLFTQLERTGVER